jgi:membrane dipeptidase
MLTRRDFLQSASLLAAVSVTAHGSSAKTDFPFVDGLSLEIFEQPTEIRASGLTAIVTDMSATEEVPTADGSPRWQRTFEATTRKMVEARQRLRKMPDVFLATDGTTVRTAFKKKQTAVFFQVQGGGEIVRDQLSRIDLLSELGLRILQITHHHNNPLGGGCIERTTNGLTKLGHDAVAHLNALGVIPDLSHASDQTGRDVLKASKKPVIISHGAARAIVNNARCAPDEIIRGIGDSGGVMGIFAMSFWLTNDPVPTVESYLRQIRHVTNVGGIDAVGIANDFPLAGEASVIAAKGDNAVAVKDYWPWWDSVAKLGVLGFDQRPTHVAIPELNNIARIHIIHNALVSAKFKSAEIEKIMGSNWIRVLSS